MKQFFVFLLVALTSVTCTNPDDNGGPIYKPKQELTVDVSAVDFTTEGGQSYVSFKSSEAWNAYLLDDGDNSWCSVSPTSGEAGKATICITATANKTTKERGTAIVIRAGKLSKTIKVVQMPTAALIVTPSKFELDCAATKIEIEVKSNINYQLAIEESAKEWIKHLETRAMNSSTLVFEIAENTTIVKREAEISFTHGELKEVVTITQKGSKPEITIPNREYSLSSDDNSIGVIIFSNVDIEVEIPADANWICKSNKFEPHPNLYYFDISANDDEDERCAEIKFSNKEYNLCEIVKVTQSQKVIINIEKDNYTIGSDGGEINVKVGHNVDFNVNIGCSWIKKVANTRAYQNDTLIFSVAPNTDKNDRSATITITSKIDQISHRITVVQTGYRAFDPSINHWGDGGENGGVTD